MKTATVVSTIFCVQAVVISAIIWLLGSSFNDTGSVDFQNSLDNRVRFTLITAVITVVLVVWHPGVLRKDGVRFAVALTGAILAFFFAIVGWP